MELLRPVLEKGRVGGCELGDREEEKRREEGFCFIEYAGLMFGDCPYLFWRRVWSVGLWCWGGGGGRGEGFVDPFSSWCWGFLPSMHGGVLLICAGGAGYPVVEISLSHVI